MPGQHYKSICQYGEMHGQCRCPSPTKAIRRVECTTPEKHKPADEAPQTVDDVKAIISGWNLSASVMGEVGGWLVATGIGKAFMEAVDS